jgi:hypothetical protein
MKHCIGLFGTCGDSRWREDIAIPILEQRQKPYFNPVVPNWTEEAMKNEVDHAANDKVVMLIITGETNGIASMAESGWIALQVHMSERDLVVVIEDCPDTIPDHVRINKTRKLLRNYIQKEDSPCIHLKNSVAEAAEFAANLMEVE